MQIMITPVGYLGKLTAGLSTQQKKAEFQGYGLIPVSKWKNQVHIDLRKFFPLESNIWINVIHDATGIDNEAWQGRNDTRHSRPNPRRVIICDRSPDNTLRGSENRLVIN